MTNRDPAPLGGEADPNSWDFVRKDEQGPLPNPVGHTFPLVTHDVDGRWTLVGTGFYVSGDGLFVTARHVIDVVLRDGEQIAPLVILHPHSDTGLFGPSKVLFRPIAQCWLAADGCDIAFGVAATCTNNATGNVLQHWSWPLSWDPPAIGSWIGTYAFPRHVMSEGGHLTFAPELYRGAVLNIGEYRDRINVPFPYLEIDCRVHGGASGGPIAAPDGAVVGVNCTEWPHNIDHPPGPAFGAQIRCLRDAFFDDGILSGEENPRRISFDELVLAGHVSVQGYVPRDPAQPFSGTLVRLDKILATARHPIMGFIQYP